MILHPPPPGRLLVLVALLAGAGCSGGGRGDQRPNIVLVTFDTTRADRLSCYGYGRETTPSIQRLAREGVVHTRAYAVSSWTLPAHASLFTGKFPTAHGARYDPQGPLRLTQAIRGHPSWDRYRARPLGPGESTLASLLRGAGYATGAVVGGPWAKRVFGLDGGFDSYDDENITEVNGRRADDVTRAAVAWIDEHADEPFFLFLNYYDPHGPFDPPPKFARRFLPPGTRGQEPSRSQIQLALYDAEIFYADLHFGRLVDHLRELDLYENTWFIVTADHGELLGENGLSGHGSSLSDAEIHIPLIVKYPGSDGPTGVDDRPVQQTDVLPMILERLGIAAPGGVQGQPPGSVEHAIVAEVYPLPMMSGPDKPWRHQGDWRALIEGDYKFMWNSLGRHILVDLSKDPLESRNLLEEQPERALRMGRRLEEFIVDLPRPGALEGEGEVDPSTMQALENRGYVDGKDD